MQRDAVRKRAHVLTSWTSRALEGESKAQSLAIEAEVLGEGLDIVR
jgi:hypothetical protein